MLLTEILVVACLVVSLILCVAVAHCIRRIVDLEDEVEELEEILYKSVKTTTEPLVFLMEEYIQNNKDKVADDEKA